MLDSEGDSQRKHCHPISLITTLEKKQASRQLSSRRNQLSSAFPVSLYRHTFGAHHWMRCLGILRLSISTMSIRSLVYNLSSGVVTTGQLAHSTHTSIHCPSCPSHRRALHLDYIHSYCLSVFVSLSFS